MRFGVRTAVVVLAAAFAPFGHAGGAPFGHGGGAAVGPAGADDDPLERARLAATQHSFTGTVSLTWRDDGTTHSEDLDVRAVGGSIEIKGEATVMAEGDRARFVRHPGGGWDQLWSGALPSRDRPTVSAKYQLVPAGSLVVADRYTRAYEIREGALLRERLYFDEENGLLLRREQLDDQGRPRRMVGFASLIFDPGMPAPRPPKVLHDRTARMVPPSELRVPVPTRLASGYARLGTYREHGVAHAVYSDGLYDLSVFEQPGRLQRRDVPDGRRMRIGPREAWTYAYAGGNILIWQAGRTVFTAVSDAPLDHLVEVARSLGPAGRSPSLLDRLRRASRAVVAPLA